MELDVLLGLQWGDEGKGKITDYLADRYDVICRFQGGPNSGHTLIIDNETVKNHKHVLHTVPSGITNPNIINIVGAEVVINPILFMKEIKDLHEIGVNTDNLIISDKASIILPMHRYFDAANEISKGKDAIGTTLHGIGPCYVDETARIGLRIGDIITGQFKLKYDCLHNKHINQFSQYTTTVGDLEKEYAKKFGYESFQEMENAFFEAIEFMKTLDIRNTEYYINRECKDMKILAEGAQGIGLDKTFGTYPYVTSSNTIAGGVSTGLGVPPQAIGKVFGVSKSYCTRVGGGPFPSRLADEEILRKSGEEYGATTGRPRGCGWIDIVQLKYNIMISGVTHLILTKIDCLHVFENIKACINYNVDGKISDQIPYNLESAKAEYKEYEWSDSKKEFQMNEQMEEFIEDLEKMLGIPCIYISTGPGRNDLLERKAT